MTQHTPGPWRVETVDEYDQSYVFVVDAGGKVVASLDPCDTAVETIARANILTKAPEMLEAVRNTAAIGRNCNSVRDFDARVNEAINRARALLKEIEGDD